MKMETLKDVFDSIEIDANNQIIFNHKLYKIAVNEIFNYKKKGEAMNQSKTEFGDFENIISLIPKLEKFAQTVKTKPDIILNELIELGYRVIEKSKDEALKEASEKLKVYIQKKDFKFSENSVNSLQSLVDFLKKHNEIKK